MNFDADALGRFLNGMLTVKFGPGPLGKIGTIVLVGVGAMLIMASIFAFINMWAGLAVTGVMAAFIFYFLHRAFNFADRHPELSAMDGAQVTRVMMQQGSMRPLEGLAPPPPIVGEVIQNPMIDTQREVNQ